MNNQNLVPTINKWDIIGVALVWYMVLLSGPSIVSPVAFLSFIGTTHVIIMGLITCEIIDYGETVRRRQLGFPPRKGFRDSLLNKVSVKRRLLVFSIYPLIIGIPMAIILFILSTQIVYWFGIKLGLDLLPFALYMIVLEFFAIPGYVIYKKWDWNRKAELWQEQLN